MKTPPPERAAGRRKLAKSGDALADGSFVIPSVPYLKKAIRAVGRAPASKRPALKKLIVKRARELKATNAPGVKGTWPFQAANDSEAIEMAAAPMRRMPVIRGAADIQMGRTGPGVISVMHKSSGLKVGTIIPSGVGYQGAHADGTKTPASGSQQGALAGLIAYHNKQAATRKTQPPESPAAEAKGYAGGEQDTLDFAGSLPVSTPAASSSDGPRVTSMSAGRKPKVVPPVKLSMGKQGTGTMSAEVAKVYKKLVAKGMSPKQAMALAKRAAAMHAKASAKAA